MNYVFSLVSISSSVVASIYFATPHPGNAKRSLAPAGVRRERLGLRQPTSFTDGLAKLCETTCDVDGLDLARK
jgi:hypothetical protein